MWNIQWAFKNNYHFVYTVYIDTGKVKNNFGFTLKGLYSRGQHVQ